MKNKLKFKIGERTTDVWCGELVTTCEFLTNLGSGQMLFYDITNKCFRKVDIEFDDDGVLFMNGWDCSQIPSKLINERRN